MDNRPIGLLDSGDGGFSVVKKVVAKLPNESTIFIGDNAHMPYGDKSKEEVIALTRQSIKFLLKKNVKLIIIACNTATAAAMPTLQKEIDQQIIGVIQSGSLAASRITHSKKVAVVATPVTIKMHAYRKEIAKRDPQIEVTELAAPKLAPLVEAMKSFEENLKVVKQSLEPIKKADFDTLVLGCTHYPLILKEFSTVLPKEVSIVDPADQVAQYTFNVMKRDHLFSSANHQAVHEYYTTGDALKFAQMGRSFLGDKHLEALHVDTERL